MVASNSREVPFANRADAGRRLARRLIAYAHQPDVLVLALPRGGVPVGFEVAAALQAPLDVFIARKLGVPGHEELAMGAIASGGVRMLNQQVVNTLNIPPHVIEQVTRQEMQELARREELYRQGRPAPPVSGGTVIVVDDGIATGATMRAAIGALRQQGAGKIVVAAPVAAVSTCEDITALADEVVCLMTPEAFYAVGQWYEDFSQTTDDEVRDLLSRSRGLPRHRLAADRPGMPQGGSQMTPFPINQTVQVPTGGESLEGTLSVPPNAQGIVLFAHGSGSSRHSPRNQQVAQALHGRGLATLLIDLLTRHEERLDMRTSAIRFDIPFLAGRLIDVTDWLSAQPATRHLPLGYFGASTGAAAALVAAAERPAVHAVVSRGGRPDLAGEALPRVQAPTLLIVGGADTPVIPINRQAYEQLTCEKRLEIVPDATHLFEEPGALDQVAALAGAWFMQHLARHRASFAP